MSQKEDLCVQPLYIKTKRKRNNHITFTANNAKTSMEINFDLIKSEPDESYTNWDKNSTSAVTVEPIVIKPEENTADSGLNQDTSQAEPKGDQNKAVDEHKEVQPIDHDYCMNTDLTGIISYTEDHFMLQILLNNV